MSKEKWKYIEGVEGRYMISNFGRIKRVERVIDSNANKGLKTRLPEKIISPQISKFGYRHVRLATSKGKIDRTIHRLVAIAFVDNPEGKPVVDHIDGNKENNHYSNLEWVSYAENNQRAYDTGLKRRIHGGQFKLGGGRL